jgi:hypothetical protein
MAASVFRAARQSLAALRPLAARVNNVAHCSTLSALQPSLAPLLSRPLFVRHARSSTIRLAPSDLDQLVLTDEESSETHEEEGLFL